MTDKRLVVAGIVVVVSIVPVLVQALRNGSLHRRGQGRIERRRQPFQFWWSIAAAATFALLGAALIGYALLKG
jgi:hypothetical protein